MSDLKKRKLCIVHIGMPKTGTSSLQKSLSLNLHDSNASYASLPSNNHSAYLFSLFHTRPEIHNINIGKSSKEIADFNQNSKGVLVKGFIEHRTDIEIISGEDVFHIDEAGLEKLKNFLDQFFNQVVIVGYIRSPKSFMESSFQQLVKYHGLNTFDFNLIYPHYRNKLEKFDKIFGVDNVHFWKYDPKNFTNNDITLDFCKRLNIQIDASTVVRENESISRDAIALLYVYNKYCIEDQKTLLKMKLTNKMVDTLSIIESEKFRFSSKLIDEILEIHKDDIVWIEKRMDTSLSEPTQDHESDVYSEEDLFNVYDETIQMLKSLLGQDIPDALPQNIKEMQIELVCILKNKILDTLKPENKDFLSENRKEALTRENEYILLKEFDIDWSQYFVDNNIENTVQDPIYHYIDNWKSNNLVVNNIFITNDYLEMYSDIKEAKINPLLHFLQYGRKENRKGKISI